MAVVEYKLQVVTNKGGRAAPLWIREGGAHENPDDSTMLGWVVDNAPYYVPDTIVTLTKEEMVQRQLRIHQNHPFKKFDSSIDQKFLNDILNLRGDPAVKEKYVKLMEERFKLTGRSYDNSETESIFDAVQSGTCEPAFFYYSGEQYYVLEGRARSYAALATGSSLSVKIITNDILTNPPENLTHNVDGDGYGISVDLMSLDLPQIQNHNWVIDDQQTQLEVGAIIDSIKPTSLSASEFEDLQNLNDIVNNELIALPDKYFTNMTDDEVRVIAEEWYDSFVEKCSSISR